MLLSMQGKKWIKRESGLGAVLSLENWLSKFQAFCGVSRHYLGNLIPVTGGNGSDKLTQASCPPSAEAALGRAGTGGGCVSRSSRSLRQPPVPSCSLLFTPVHACVPGLAHATTHSVCVEWTNKLKTEEVLYTVRRIRFGLYWNVKRKPKRCRSVSSGPSLPAS